MTKFYVNDKKITKPVWNRYSNLDDFTVHREIEINDMTFLLCDRFGNRSPYLILKVADDDYRILITATIEGRKINKPEKICDELGLRL